MNKQYEHFMDWVIYQIYPRSFKDTNGDGIGDIPGIIEKLDYLVELGVNAIWICPCYKSPGCDNGYDISDFRDIQDEFGTLDDVKKLIAEMHARGMKLIMDLVPNHSSDEHPWFQASRRREGKYADYYYWADEPVNDWQSAFGGSAWQYDEIRGQYYLHSYAIGQPDLNWDNPEVVKEIQAIVDYWVNLGVDGFRIDVIDQISKDFVNNKESLGPHLHEYIHALFGREETAHLFTVGECWGVGDMEEMRRHIAPEREELTTVFQFAHIEAGREGKYNQSQKSMKELRDMIIPWQKCMQEENLLYSIFMENHDQSPLISRVADDGDKRYESATCLAAMFYLLRGIPFIYQGQEIGITSSRYESIDDYNDLEALNMYQSFLDDGLSEAEAIEKLNFGSRDNARRPFAWNGDIYGGFSDCRPWITIGSRKDEINLEKDLSSEHSIWRFYQAVLSLRKEYPAFRQGHMEILSQPEDNYFIYTREAEGKVFTVVCNFEQDSQIESVQTFGEKLLGNYKEFSDSASHFRPYETAVFCR